MKSPLYIRRIATNDAWEYQRVCPSRVRDADNATARRRDWGAPVFPYSLAGVGLKPGPAAAHAQHAELEQLDRRVRTIPGTLTQEIPPRLGPDLFRLIDDELSEEQQARYPVPMLHNAYDHLLQKDEEIARLRHQLHAVQLAAEGTLPPAPLRFPGLLRLKRLCQKFMG